MKAGFVIAVVFAGALSASGDTLRKGAVYFDSRETLGTVIALAAAGDNAGIEKLINDGHVSHPTLADADVVVTLVGETPESPAEFYFAANPKTYWTLTKFLAAYPSLAPSNSITLPRPSPTSTPSPVAVEPTPEASPTPEPVKATRQSRRGVENPPPGLDTDGGRRIWHRNAKGEWKYYLRDYPPKVKKKE